MKTVMVRPKLKLKKSSLETVLNIVSVISIMALAVYIVLIWNEIPHTIPIHFNANGDPDNHESKNVIWVFIALNIVIWSGFSLLERFPHKYHYSFLTEDNTEKQYKNARCMLNCLKAEIVLFFSYESWEFIQFPLGKLERLSSGSVLLAVLIVFLTLIFFIVRSFKLK
ncbi:DUF1648 domain-containing protein [Peribacillus sp. B-H-3]|uniref:DUF1648 domain-containing protein n=1 Tax=Peribacillus sp. B-H-3 TaxID=3400420 RepID=UPI003B019757